MPCTPAGTIDSTIGLCPCTGQGFFGSIPKECFASEDRFFLRPVQYPVPNEPNPMELEMKHLVARLKLQLLLCVFFIFGCGAHSVANPSADATLPTPTRAPTASNGVLSMEVIPQYGVVLSDSDGSLNVLLRLKGQENKSTKRPDLDLAIVLDRSGSMSGGKIVSVKTAALKLLDELNESDRVTLISYASNVQLHAKSVKLDAEGKASLKNHILGIRSGGSTALGPALFQALDHLEGGDRGTTSLAHVMLLSDGLANVGPKNPEVIGRRTALAFKHGITVSTLGVGLDYNEDLMTRVADQGGGRYHFIENETTVAKVLQDELASLSGTVAGGTEIALRAKNNVKISKVFGYPTEEKDGVTRIKIGAIGSGQTREIVVQLAIKPKSKGPFDVGTFELSFRDVAKESKAQTVRLPLSLKVSSDTAVVKASEQVEVTVRVAEVESATRLEHAARAVDKGDYAGAKKVLNESLTSLRKQNVATPSAVLQQQIEDLEEAESGIAEAQRSEKARKKYVKGNKARNYKSMKK